MGMSAQTNRDDKDIVNSWNNAVQLSMAFFILLFGVTAVLAYIRDGRIRTETKVWTIERDDGMPLKFTGKVIGRVGLVRTMTLYRSNDGKYIFSRSSGASRGNLWIVLGDQLPTSQQIVDLAGWNEDTKKLLKDAGLPTEVSLAHR